VGYPDACKGDSPQCTRARDTQEGRVQGGLSPAHARRLHGGQSPALQWIQSLVRIHFLRQMANSGGVFIDIQV